MAHHILPRASIGWRSERQGKTLYLKVADREVGGQKCFRDFKRHVQRAQADHRDPRDHSPRHGSCVLLAS